MSRTYGADQPNNSRDIVETLSQRRDAEALFLRPEFIAGLCFAALTAAFLYLPITHDAIWQMWIGRQMLHGAKLYVDILEVNPPLWFWMAVPIAAVGEVAHIEARILVIGFFVASIILSLWLSPARYRVYLLIASVFLPLHDFGQREHFTFITTAPYVFLIAARLRGDQARRPMAVGLWASLGFALKPHFVVVPLALELLLWANGRRRILRPETLVVLGCATAYAVAILIFAPAFLTYIVPSDWRAYGFFRGAPNPTLLLAPFALAGLGLVLARRRVPAVTKALAIAALAFIPAVLVQDKGWAYQSVPARGFLFLAVMLALSGTRRQPIAYGFLAVSAFLCFLPIGIYRNQYRREMETHLSDVPSGSSIVVLASNPKVAWPMVEEHHLRWTMRQFSLWQIPAIVSGQDKGIERDLKRIVAEDLNQKPDVLIVDRRPVEGDAAKAMLPKGYLDEYIPQIRTPRLESYFYKRSVRLQHREAALGRGRTLATDG